MALLEADALQYRVGPAVLVDRVSIRVSAGELVAVIGPNGAGKTTLLRLLAGDLQPGAGRVVLGGDGLEQITPEDRALRRAVLAQHPLPDIPFTARAVVTLGRHPHRRDPANSATSDARAVAEALERTDALHLADRSFATLSGGERTRVTLARVFAQEAPLVLLDEPTAALDVGHQELIMTDLRRRAARGVGVLAVLHDLNTAATFANRLVLLSEGKLVAEGPPREVLQDGILSEVYRHPLRVIDHPFRDAPLVLVAG